MNHIPVLLEESIKYLITNIDGIYVDATFGLGGHSKRILQNISPKGRIIGIDRDLDAVNLGRERFSSYKNITIFHSSFSKIAEILNLLKIEYIDGILFDFGISSMQIDSEERGFSYNQDTLLDMRMDKSQSLSAYDVVNCYPQEKLEEIIKNYGEERYAKKIARKIIEFRSQKEIKTTGELAQIVKNAVPLPQDGHPAKRTFQAIRIEVNNELEEIKQALNNVVPYLRKGGRICAISFHSLEDRIVKEFFKYESLKCICPKDIPICQCNKEKRLEIITKKPIVPSEEEVKRNKRSHSAKLRVAQRV